jgi:hypothetical protein
MVLHTHYYVFGLVLNRNYHSFCYVPALPFLNVCDVVEIQSKLIIWGTACTRLVTCWCTVQGIHQHLSYSNSTISQLG